MFEDSTSVEIKKKAIVKHVKSRISGSSKDLVKKALKSLEQSGEISPLASDKRVYVKVIVNSENKPQHIKSSEPPLPIAEILRRRNEKDAMAERKPESKSRSEEIPDIDEEIRRLEAELNEDSYDEESSGFLSEDKKEKEIHNDGDVGTDGILRLSALTADHIAPLPSNYLPTVKSKPLKIDKEQSETKRKRQKMESNVSEGLKAAVKSVLDGYVPRSNERLPLYCRVCAKQYSNEEGFFKHKQSDFHKAAVEMEKKVSYCKLCQKQLTSPVQLKEHISSRPHKERLQLLKNRQQKNKGPI